MPFLQTRSQNARDSFLPTGDGLRISRMRQVDMKSTSRASLQPGGKVQISTERRYRAEMAPRR